MFGGDPGVGDDICGDRFVENVIQNIYDKDVEQLERQKLGGHCPVLCLHTHYTHISRGKDVLGDARSGSGCNW